MRTRQSQAGSTRTSAPVPSTYFVPRPRLNAVLDAAIRRPLCLVMGGPGTGKTDAVAGWARLHAQTPVAWVGIDRTVRTAPRAWAAIIAALNSALGEDALGRLIPPPIIDEDFLVTLRSRLEDHQVILVIDDVHDADASVPAGLDHLLAMPSTGLRVVLISRHAPDMALSRHRLAGRLSEVLFDQLAFTREEVDPLARRLETPLDGRLLDDLLQVTGGWAAGLRLALLAMEGTADPAAVLASFGGGEPLVEGYLTEELQRSLGDDLFDMLIRTCITDRICPSLAVALTGDSAISQKLWSRLGEAPLVSRLSEPGWFRFHPLLQQMLRAKLQRQDPALLTALHTRAALWFEQTGDAMTALDHAIDSRDADLAVRIALRSATVEFVVGDAAALQRSITRIPHTGPSLIAEHLALRAVEAFCRGQVSVAEQIAGRAEPLLHHLPEPRRSLGLVNVHMVRTMIARLRGDAVGVIGAGSAAAGLLAQIETDDAPGWCRYRDMPHSLVGLGHLWTGYPTAAVASLQESRGLDSESTFADHGHVSHGSHLALALVCNGSEAEGRSLARRVVSVAADMGNATTAFTTQAWISLGLVAVLRRDTDELDRIMPSIERAVAEGSDPFARVLLHLIRAVQHMLSSERSAALRELAHARSLLQVHPGLAHASQLLAGVAMWVEGAVEEAAPIGPPPEVNLFSVMQARALLSSEPQRVRDLVTTAAQRPGTVGALAWLTIMEAEDHLRHDSLALAALSNALDRSAPAGISAPYLVPRAARLEDVLRRHQELVGTHPAFVEEVLTMVRERTPAEPGEQVQPTEPLTDRERVIVGYLPTMRSNAEIAEALQISVNTVKQHLKSVHRKLGVGSRREVVRIARELDLLP